MSIIDSLRAGITQQGRRIALLEKKVARLEAELAVFQENEIALRLSSKPHRFRRSVSIPRSTLDANQERRRSVGGKASVQQALVALLELKLENAITVGVIERTITLGNYARLERVEFIDGYLIIHVENKGPLKTQITNPADAEKIAFWRRLYP